MPENKQTFIEKVGDHLYDLAILTTAVVGIYLGIHARFFSIDIITGGKDPSFIVLAFLGLIAVGLWGERRKIEKKLTDSSEKLQNKLSEMVATSQIFSAVSDLDKTTREKVVYLAKQHTELCKVQAVMDSDVNKIIDRVMDEINIRIDACMRGQINLPKPESPNVCYEIMNAFRERMDAVSDNDLEFWLEQTGQKYLEKSIEPIGKIKKRSKVTRIFIIKRCDFEKRFDLITEVLKDQYSKNIGFGIAIHEGLQQLRREIESSNKNYNIPASLDFALFNQDRTVTFFRKGIEPERFIAVFSTNNSSDVNLENNSLIQRQKDIWVKLIAECWVVSDVFSESFKYALTPKELEQIRRSTARDNNAIKEKTGFTVEDSIFPLIIESSEEIEVKVKKAYDLYVEKNL